MGGVSDRATGRTCNPPDWLAVVPGSLQASKGISCTKVHATISSHRAFTPIRTDRSPLSHLHSSSFCEASTTNLATECSADLCLHPSIRVASSNSLSTTIASETILECWLREFRLQQSSS